MQLTLRKVCANPANGQFERDARFVLNVRNNKETRSASFDTRVIGWPEHVEWYSKVASDPRRHLYIIEFAATDIGTVRLDRDDANPAAAEIHVALHPDFRGRGLGSAVLEHACRLATELGCHTMLARIKSNNVRSLKLFQKAGFFPRAETAPAGDGVTSLERILT